MKKKEALMYHIDVCRLHAERMDMALKATAHLRPFSVESFPLSDPTDMAFLELFTNRLGKLQDALGSKVFPLLLEALGDSVEGDTFLDVLHKLEKIEVIEGTKQWFALRNLRNVLSHEYPESPQLMIQPLNEAVMAAAYLCDILHRVEHITETIVYDKA